MAEPVYLYTDYNDIRQIRRDVFDKIKNRASTLTKTLKKIDYVYDMEETRRITDGIALEEAISFMKGTGIKEMILYSFIEAAYQTKEYNYDLYIDRLQSAISSNWEDMVYFSVDPTSFTAYFMVDGSPLGSIEEWGEAVESARATLRIGKVEERDMAMASHMWEEKIYKTGREGRTIKRTKTRTGEDGKKETYEEDVTERYSYKYRETIATRLSVLQANQAPFWYLIENGSVDGTIGQGGDPYPNFGPTHVLNEIEKNLNQLFDSAFTEYKVRADKYLSKLLAESISNASEIANYSIEDVRGMANYLESKSYDGIMGGPLMEETSRTVENVINDVEEFTYTVKGKTYTKLRDAKTKQFLKGKGQ